MMNIYETVRSGLFFNKFEVDDIIFVEYSCPIEDESTVIWSQSDYLVHVLSGKKTWRTIEGTWTISAGQTVFIKKGAAIIDQFFDEEFCMLGFFISDDFIENTVKEFSGKIEIVNPEENSNATAIEVKNDDIMGVKVDNNLIKAGVIIDAEGANRILLLDVHALQIPGYFDIPVDHLFATPVLFNYFRDSEEEYVIVSPDAGGVERARFFAKLLNANMAIIDKRRYEKNNR